MPKVLIKDKAVKQNGAETGIKIPEILCLAQ